jgi:hypothetical protein
MRQLYVAALAGILACATVKVAQAADDNDTRVAKEHYKLGLDAYKAGHYPEAIKELKKAYSLKKLPPLLLNIGATYRKMGNIEEATTYYQRYLQEAPDARDRPEVEKILAEMGASNGAGTAPTPPAEPAPPAPPSGDSWQHTVVDAAPPNQPVDVRVTMPVQKGVKVYVYYRGAGEADFTPVVMRRRGAEKVGRIPATALGGKSLQYYVEGKDEKGNIVRAFGSAGSPNVVMIDPSAKPQVIDETAVAAAAPGASDDEVRKDLDDEAAPITGEVAEKNAARKHPGASSSGGSKKLGGLFWGGVAVAAVGAAALGVGVYGLYQAKTYSDVVGRDSQGGASGPYPFNDPEATPYDDRTAEVRGKNWNNLGIGMAVGGGVALAAGLTMIIVDRVKGGGPAEKKPAKRSSSTAFILAPSAGPNSGGLAAVGRF